MLPHVLMLLGFSASDVGASAFQVCWCLGVNTHIGVGAE